MPTPRTAVRREGPDACPGVRSVWAAVDGGLARVRIPGGRLTAEQVEVVATAAEELGTGVLELTGRANLQVRGLRPNGEHDLADRLRRAGLLPSDAHDRVRNIVASPLTGLVSTRPDVSSVVTAIDDGLMDDASLARLPGRFLFAVDDGAGDVAGLMADVTLIADAAGYALLLGGAPVGRVRDPVAAALAAARAFLAERTAQSSPAWRLAELDEGPARVAARLAVEESVSLITERGVVFNAPSTYAGPESPGNPALSSVMSAVPGRHMQLDGRVAVVVDVPEGRLDVAGARALAARSTGELRVTPWRSVVLPHLDPAEVGA